VRGGIPPPFAAVAAEAGGRLSLPAAAVLLAVDGVADLPRGFTGAAADMTRYLVCLAPGPQISVARRAAGYFLRHTLNFLSDSLYFLFGCLPAERCHALSSLRTSVKQEVFRFFTTVSVAGNAGHRHRRLSSKET
jgi:hypothetical protein